jgi:hypothetical protein
MVDDLMRALPAGGPTYGTEIRVTRAYYDKLRRLAEPEIYSGVSMTAFGTPVIVDDEVPADPGFVVTERKWDTPSQRLDRESPICERDGR